MSKTSINLVLLMIFCIAFASTASAASEEKSVTPPTQEEAQKATKELTQLFESERPAAQKAAGQNEEKKAMLPLADAKTPLAENDLVVPADLQVEKAAPTSEKEGKETPPAPALTVEEIARLKQLSKLMGDLDVLKVKVEIAQQQKRLKELNQFIKPAPKKIYRFPRPKAQKKIVPPVVLSVQGIGNKLTATLQFQSAGKPTRTVSTGDIVTMGTVARIAHNGVSLNTKDGVLTLPFKE
ncbi:hypothetical protein [Halodesulfovibrio sp.]|jgi:hypothetical protein|uniref:hypothetical protein n=1 Tax=Halodesulfovibrio sp. TaxID=1912772 RepID=UPI0025F229A3|nr:hypothetical protein [Halodesulfovibrio sp.]MCT4533760.1 hypothetical protein [Halodesulfovibrio sp.]